MRPDIGNVEFRSDFDEVKLLIKSGRLSARIAPQERGFLLTSILDARQHERFAKPEAAHLGRGGHAAQLQCLEMRAIRKRRLKKRGNPDKLQIYEGAKMACVRRVISRKARRFNR